MGVVGTRDFMPYHHDSEYTKSIGSRDQFVNTMFNQALFGRFVTDWCGPDADFRATTLRMIGQVCPGDTAILEGRVAKKHRDGDDYLVELELNSRNHLGTACISTATMALPSREGGAGEAASGAGEAEDRAGTRASRTSRASGWGRNRPRAPAPTR